MDKKEKNNSADEAVLLEFEYESLEKSDKKRPKRLQAKEKKSKKSENKLVTGRVLECFSNNLYRVRFAEVAEQQEDDRQDCFCSLSGRFKNVDFAESRSIVVVGDYVEVDVSANPRIEEIKDRKNELKRYINVRSRETEVLIAANIDQVIITSSCFEPELNLNLIDRYLCAAAISNIAPIICVTKTDLINDACEKQAINKALDYYVKNGYPVVYTSIVRKTGIKRLKKLLKDKQTVFSGPSGAGKSSLINILEPSVNQKTGDVSDYNLKGRHITSGSKMIEWSFGGYLIDTPGIKTFGLHSKSNDVIPGLFPGFKEYAETCRFSSCTHRVEEGCRVLEEVSKGTIPQERYQSYLHIRQLSKDFSASSD